jgi:hypothetical protein
MLFGNDNKLADNLYTMTLGDYNDISNAEYVFTVGSSNKIGNDATSTIVFGDNNTLIDASFAFVVGNGLTTQKNIPLVRISDNSNNVPLVVFGDNSRNMFEFNGNGDMYVRNTLYADSVDVTGPATLTVRGRSILNDVSANNLDVSGNLQMNNNRILFGVEDRIKIGTNSGRTGQSTYAIAIGAYSGETLQGVNAVAIGAYSGNLNQGDHAVSIGVQVGQTNQRAQSVSIGFQSGLTDQSGNSVAIGNSAGYTGQGASSIAIGLNAGYTGQGATSVAIGNYAGHTNQQTKTIVLNATDISLNADISNAFYVKPIRNVNTNSNRLTYDLSRGEITYEANTIAQIHDVSGASSAASGMGLIYNSANTTWEARQRDYFTLTVWGDLSGAYFNNINNKNILALNSTNWQTIPSGASLVICPSGDTRYSTSNGVITLSSTKQYLINVDASILTLNSGTSASDFLVFVLELINDPLGSGTVIAASKMSQPQDPNYVMFSLHLSYILQNISTIRVNIYQETAGTYLTTIPGNINTEICLSILEI